MRRILIDGLRGGYSVADLGRATAAVGRPTRTSLLACSAALHGGRLCGRVGARGTSDMANRPNSRLAKPERYTYPRAALVFDMVVFTVVDVDLKLLVIRRGEEPLAGQCGLSKGVVRVSYAGAPGEDLAAAASRELAEEPGLRDRRSGSGSNRGRGRVRAAFGVESCTRSIHQGRAAHSF